MKRSIVFALLALAVIVLVSPGIVGRLAERNLRQSISWAEQENDDLIVTEEKFERGWFTAAGRHRIELKDGVLRSGPAELADEADAGGNAALIIETRIDHGLVPLTSMSRDSGSLQPALASTVSTLQVDPGDGEMVVLPGNLYSRIGLTGETVSRYELGAGTYRNEEVDLRWNGADIRFTIDAAASAMQYDGRIEPLSLRADGDTTNLGAIVFDGKQQTTDYGFSLGEIALEMQAVSFERASVGASGFGSLRLDAHSELQEQRVNGTSSLDLEDLKIPGLGDVDLGMDVAVNGLEAATLQKIVEGLQSVRGADDPDAALSRLYPQIESELKAFLKAGAEFRIDRFDLSLPQGDVTATMRFNLPEAGRDADFSWPGLILALTAAADIRVPAALVEMAQESNPQAGALVAMGILKRDGDAYVVKAEYAEGLVTVNGAPMPIPLGTLTGSGTR